MAAVLEGEVVLLPAVIPDPGPFQRQETRWKGPVSAIASGERMAAMSCYLALMTAECLGLIGHDGTVVVEGPFARNAIFCRMLSVASQSAVAATEGITGTSQGAALLAAPGAFRTKAAVVRAPERQVAAMQRYAALWRRRAGPGQGPAGAVPIPS